MKLVVGKNSSIVRQIASKLHHCDLVSHADLGSVNFGKYSSIFVFSWSQKRFADNVSLLANLPLEKVVFISTSAVLSLLTRRQWKSYPNWKLAAERIVLCGGGRVVRLGVCSEDIVRRSVGFLPFTSIDEIADFVNRQTLPIGVTGLYSVKAGGVSGLAAKINFFIYQISRLLPSYAVFQLPIEVATRLFVSRSYGYSADSASVFGSDLLVGYGALGSAVYRSLRRNKGIRPRVVVSGLPDITLTGGGFRGTRIGRDRLGLAKLWHGVYVRRGSGDVFRKVVPIFVRRKSLPLSHASGHVTHVKIRGDGALDVSLFHPLIQGATVVCDRLYLAAGPTENCRILQSFSEMDVELTDHEIGCIGYICAREAAARGDLKTDSIFLCGRSVRAGEISGHKFMLDFRPYNPRLGREHQENIYNNSPFGVMAKLIRRLSFYEINEAFFNKFGFGLRTSKVSVFIQIENKDCIRLRKGGALSRVRLGADVIQSLINELSAEYGSFSAAKPVFLFDGQHIFGGGKLLADDTVARLLADKKIFIYGSPSADELGAFHHTQRLIDEVNKFS